MTRRLLAVALALVFGAITAGSTLAIGDPGIRTLPFAPEKCRLLIERGAPFQLGGPDTNEVCIIIIGGAPSR